MATDEADSDNKFSPEDYGEEDKENNEADVEFEFEMKSDSDSEISAAAGLPCCDKASPGPYSWHDSIPHIIYYNWAPRGKDC